MPLIAHMSILLIGSSTLNPSMRMEQQLMSPGIGVRRKSKIVGLNRGVIAIR